MPVPSQPRRAPAPWSPADATTTFWPSLLGVAMVAWAWWQASGSASQDEQTTWTVIAVLGVAIVTFGLTAWVRAGRRAVRQRRESLMERLAEAVALVEGAPGTVATTAEVAEPHEGFATYPAATRYHRPGCLLTLGKGAQSLEGGSRAGSSLQPCEMCQS
jgi:hypothetical protein